MNKRENTYKKILTITGLIVLVFALLAVFISSREPSTYEQTDQYGKELLVFNYKMVDQIEIAADKEYLFQRQQDSWQIVKPLAAKADDVRIRELMVSALNMRIFDSYIVRDKDLKEFGLKKGSTTVEFTFEDGRTKLLILGDKEKNRNRIYVNTGDSLVHTVALRYKKDFEVTSVFEWRDKSLVNITQYEVNEIKLKNSNGIFHLMLSDGRWMLVHPDNTLEPADDHSVIAFINAIATARMQEIFSEKPDSKESYGLSAPETEVELRTGSEKVMHRLVFSSVRDNRVYGMNIEKNIIFSIPPSVAEGFKRQAFDFQDKKIASMDVGKITAVRIMLEGNEYTFLKRAANQWVNSREKPVNHLKVNSLLNTLNSWRATDISIPEDSKLLQNAKGGSVILIEAWADEDYAAKLKFFKKDNQQWYLFSCSDNRLYQIKEYDLNDGFEKMHALLR